VLWNSGFVGFPSHKLSPCLWPTPCLLKASAWCLFSFFAPVPSLRALANFWPIASVVVPVACAVVLILRAPVDLHPTGWLVQWTMVLVQWCMALEQWSLVLDLWMIDWINGHWLWITGDWWMMLVLPSWYCVRSRNCAISPSPLHLPNWSLVHFPTTLLVYFVGFSLSTFYCYRSDTWSHVAHLILLLCNLKHWRSCVSLDFTWFYCSVI